MDWTYYINLSPIGESKIKQNKEMEGGKEMFILSALLQKFNQSNVTLGE